MRQLQIQAAIRLFLSEEDELGRRCRSEQANGISTLIGNPAAGFRDEMSPDGVGQQRIAVTGAALCEWLHGYEAASGNGYNHFDPKSTLRALGVSDFYLGFEAARLSETYLEEFCDIHEEDIGDLNATSLSLITRELRSGLRDGLSDFFGGDGVLFWALHTTIWPGFEQPMEEAADDFLQLRSEDYSELETPWFFVTEGWCDAADA